MLRTVGKMRERMDEVQVQAFVMDECVLAPGTPAPTMTIADAAANVGSGGGAGAMRVEEEGAWSLSDVFPTTIKASGAGHRSAFR